MSKFKVMKWKFRVKKHYMIRTLILLFCKFIFHKYIADKSIVDIQESENGFDRYFYCKNDLKKSCPIGRKAKYMLYIKYYGYMFYGNDEYECYLEAIKKFYSTTPLVFPHCKKWTKKSGMDYIA